ncbi:hypothetical protein V0R48_07085 [Pseudomonas alcaligenes]|uniref:XAC2610-related protein n=1 Tax=Aquipseudomonas alcaligenes TaxID=43263 RepID=UPI002E7C2AD0|nr:hypothetical protein [Pseudomonas alcaligenes]MEE1948730.1 hypothetical protein [Pseudomonas alcaligenes]
MAILRYALMLLFLINTSALACEQNLNFSPNKGIEIEAYTKEQTLLYKIVTSENINSHKIKFDTDKKISIAIKDFNFDDHLDMSISHLDDGMGVFTVSRVFIYSPAKKDFYEIFPNCGEQFLNLRIDADNRKLISSYFNNNIPTTCETYTEKIE